tara:strand:+ start:1308 stop:1505 length:198 start_codon:yes stop_codon:yes gene_type:complete
LATRIILLSSGGKVLSLLILNPIPNKTKGDHIFLATQYRYLYPLGSNKKIANGINSNITGKADRA